MAGGGMKTGQAIGETNKHAEHATKRPVTFPEVFATLFNCLGINLSETLIATPADGRNIWSSRTGRASRVGVKLTRIFNRGKRKQ